MFSPQKEKRTKRERGLPFTQKKDAVKHCEMEKWSGFFLQLVSVPACLTSCEQLTVWM